MASQERPNRNYHEGLSGTPENCARFCAPSGQQNSRTQYDPRKVIDAAMWAEYIGVRRLSRRMCGSRSLGAFRLGCTETCSEGAVHFCPGIARRRTGDDGSCGRHRFLLDRTNAAGLPCSPEAEAHWFRTQTAGFEEEAALITVKN